MQYAFPKKRSHAAEVFCSLLTYAAAYYIFHLGLEGSASRR